MRWGLGPDGCDAWCPSYAALVLCNLMAGITCLAATDPSVAQSLNQTAEQGGSQSPASGQKTYSYARQITRRGKVVVISRGLADEVRKDNVLLLSAVAIKARVDKGGSLSGYELVEIDRGSIAEKIGFKAKDRIIAVNGVPAGKFEENWVSLQSADRFDVTIVRKGKRQKIVAEIRDTGR